MCLRHIHEQAKRGTSIGLIKLYLKNSSLYDKFTTSHHTTANTKTLLNLAIGMACHTRTQIFCSGIVQRKSIATKVLTKLK